MSRTVILMGIGVMVLSIGGVVEARATAQCTSKEAFILDEGAISFRCGVPGPSCTRLLSWGRTFECPGTPAALTQAGTREPMTSARRLRTSALSSRERRRVARERRHSRTAAPPKTPLASPLPMKKTQPNQMFVPQLPLPNIKAVSSFLLLGSKSGYIAAIEVTPQDEPVHVRKVSINLTSAVSSLVSLEVGDDLGYVLGSATRDLTASSAGDVYVLNLSPGNAYAIERRDTIGLGVRAVTQEEDAGGAAGETVQVEDIDITATGLWTDQSNLVSTSGTEFQKHQTTNAILKKIERKGKEESTFTTGNAKVIGSFTFEAVQNADADPALSSLSFSVSAPGEVSLSSVLLRDPSGGSSQSCSIASSTITCSGISDSLGSLQSPRSLDLVADVTLSGSHPDPYLQIELNTPGRPGSAGAISWTDGDSAFTWVPFDSPIAQGTLWK